MRSEKNKNGAWRCWTRTVPVALPDKNKNYRPSDKEPFMNERQREYFRDKLLLWKDDILKEAKETLQHLQDENQNHPDLADRGLLGDRPGRSSCARRDRSAADRQDRRRACSGSRTAPMGIAKRPANRSRSDG